MRIRHMLFFLTLPLLGSYGCSSPFSELQSARLVEKNHVEGTAYYSSMSIFDNGENGKLQDHIGLQFGYGLSDEMNLRFRYERLSTDLGDGTMDLTVNVWSFGPKFGFADGQYALYLPVGFATGDRIESQETWELHPTLLQTIDVNESLEINTSLKYMIRFHEDADNTIAFNLGLGLGSDLKRVVFRPETGIMINPGSDGLYWHWSVGVTVFQ